MIKLIAPNFGCLYINFMESMEIISVLGQFGKICIARLLLLLECMA